MKKPILFPILVIFALISFSNAGAVVRVVDATGTAEATSPAFTSEEVDTVSGNNPVGPADFSLLFCGTLSEAGPNVNFFDLPSPGNWTELDNGQCGASGCVGGIWWNFTGTANNIETTCSWDVPHFLFVGGTFRYADVDRNDPIIDIACQSGIGPVATAPSIVTEPGSHVVRAATFSATGARCPVLLAEEITIGILDLCASSDIENIWISAFTITDLEGGPTGEDSIELPLVDTEWRACTIGIRMSTGIRPIPTMSEWGFLAVAVFMGAAGVWYLRRKQAA